MKYRIKMVVYGNGKTVYYPQCKKGWFRWKNIVKIVVTVFTTYSKSKAGVASIEAARECIQRHIMQENANKISSTKYIEYP